MEELVTVVLTDFNDDLKDIISKIEKANIKKDAMMSLVMQCNNEKMANILSEKYAQAFEVWQLAMNILQQAIFEDTQGAPEGAFINVNFITPSVSVDIPRSYDFLVDQLMKSDKFSVIS